jgi:hypothetical protein
MEPTCACARCAVAVTTQSVFHTKPDLLQVFVFPACHSVVKQLGLVGKHATLCMQQLS